MLEQCLLMPIEFVTNFVNAYCNFQNETKLYEQFPESIRKFIECFEEIKSTEVSEEIYQTIVECASKLKKFINEDDDGD